jgi:DNA-binding Lrp family transcriptional regulator
LIWPFCTPCNVTAASATPNWPTAWVCRRRHVGGVCVRSKTVVTSWVTVPSWTAGKLVLGVLAFVRVDAERNTGDATRQLEAAITRLPEVISCHYISGNGTFELQVVAEDLDSFSRFALQSLINLPNVKDLQTSFSLGEVKAAGPLPLGHLGSGETATGR